MSINQSVAIVVGGKAGIGNATAKLLLNQDISVQIVGRVDSAPELAHKRQEFNYE